MNRPDAITRTLDSGFTISVVPMPPYYMDVIDNVYTKKQYPKRVYTNTAGDSFTLDYQPPETLSDDADDIDRDLFYEWQHVKQYNKDLDQKKLKAREDFLLSMCVDITDGPVDITDRDWQERVEAVFGEGFKVPKHPGALRLLFLKAVVITSPDDKEWIIQTALFKEVSMQDISYALHNFRDNVG